MKAKITQKSNVDPTGELFVTFDIFDDEGNELYSAIQIHTTPSMVGDAIRERLRLLELARTEAESINVGEEITL